MSGVLKGFRLENKQKIKKILLKISGEFFKEMDKPFSFGSSESIASEIKKVHEMGVKIGVVVGGGNIIRGAKDSKEVHLPQDVLDELGMQATLINGGVLATQLEEKGVLSTVLSAIPISLSIGEPYNRNRIEHLLSMNHVLIFVGGTGNPYFTTDTASVLRALQMGVNVLLKATKVDGVYDKDPLTSKDACLFGEITYKDAIDKGLKIMDLTAFSMAWEHNLPIIVFNATVPGNIEKVVRGEKIGTLVVGGTNR